MICRRNHDLIRYVAGDLPPRAREAFERHLAQCPACRRELGAAQRLEGLLRHVGPPAPPADLPARALARARATWRPPTPRAPVAVQALAGSAAVAATLMLAVFVSHLARSPELPVAPREVAVAPLAPVEPVPAEPPTVVALPPIVPPVIARAAAEPPAARVRVTRDARPRLALGVTVPAAAPRATEPRATAPFSFATVAYAAADDPDLRGAALENIAATSAEPAEAARALLAAADLRRSRGELREADVAYGRLAASDSAPGLTRALAHKARGDLRREAVAEDEVAHHHYREAARLLELELPRVRSADRARALLALGEVRETMGESAGAAAAFARAAALSVDAHTADETAIHLARVL